MAIKNFDELISRLKTHLPEYVAEKLGVDPLSQFSCPNPDHDDCNPSAGIVGLDGPAPRIHCLGCGCTLDLFDLVRIIEDKPTAGVEWVEDTLRYLANKYGLEFEADELTPEQLYELDTYRAYRVASHYLQTKGEGLEVFAGEVARRHWDPSVLQASAVGTIANYADFRSALKQEGFAAKFLDEIDLGRSDIFCAENLIFTWKDERGRPVGFTSRNIKFEEQKEAGESGKRIKKYNNQRGTGLKCNIFHKGSRLYGIDEAVTAGAPVYIFEGQADVISARHHHINNCVAIAGGELREDHILLLKQLSIYEIILCMDGDKPGQEKLDAALEKLAGHRDIHVKVIQLPVTEDPDSFLRTQGEEAFRALPTISAFEYRLDQFPDETGPEEICEKMVPFIVSETSAVRRENLCNHLASRTGIQVRSIMEDVEAIINEKMRERSQTRREILERMQWELSKGTTDAEQILQRAKSELQELEQRYHGSAMSCESFVQDIQVRKEEEERTQTGDTSFELGPDLGELREWLRGDWTDTFMIYGGKANVGKSSLLCKMAYEIAQHNPDTIVIFHTIDDTLGQILPRFVCVANGDRKLTINQVRQPGYWRDKVQNLDVMRELGYQKVMGLASAGRLIIKDITHGSTLAFAENLLEYHRRQNPDKRIVYFLDNFHKLSDYSNKDERVRNKQLSSAIKGIATRYHIPIISTVEYTKIPPGTKPSKYNIAESVQMEYDANFIAHLYSELSDIPESFSVCHNGVNWKGEQVILPRVEVIVDKNKITEQKGSLYFNFWPSSSDYSFVQPMQVTSDAEVFRRAKGVVKNMNEGFQRKE